MKLTKNEELVERLLGRRELLGLLGATTAAALIGCSTENAASEEQATKATKSKTVAVPDCVVRPEQEEGPYFADDRLNRSDIRSDPTDGSVRAGTPLRIAFNVRQMTGKACVPLSGAVVDVWQCDALGVYSQFKDIDSNFDTRDKKFLRGYQETDAQGRSEFTTIYPGWYPGRAVHIHYKIRTSSTSGMAHVFTSQLYFDDALTDQVHSKPPYAARGNQRARNEGDEIFRGGGKDLLLKVVPEGQGYAGIFDIALQFSPRS